jgi:poly-gamma-glutamate synthesis protein (capsule biosynthesis protein)
MGEIRRGPSVGPVAVAVGIVAVLAVAVILLAGPGANPAASPGPSGSGVAVGSAGGLGSGSPSTSAGSGEASPSASAAGPSPSPSGATLAEVPIVPVVDFRSTETSVTSADVKAALGAGAGRYKAVELVAGDADAILAELGASRPSASGRLILAKDAATLVKDLAKNRDRLAFLRADQVSPAVRALAWGAKALFGVDRVTKLADWPLRARLAAATGASAFDPAATWTMVAGGDIMLDRGVAKVVKIQGKGVDFPFNGGTATITGRTCCSALDNPVPVTRRTGGAGAVRRLLKSADLAVANFENPAPDAFRYHTQGTVFSADPRLIAGLAHAGIDIVSIGNNHIRDAGAQGILDTIRNLKKNGIKSTGAGANLAAARKPAIADIDGVKVAILGYDTIAKAYAAGASRAGSAQLSAAVVRADIKKARAAGADVVIVYPHWGTEYTPRPFAGQQSLARAIIDAGADMVIGNHAHWVGAMEVYKGRPIWYALGNFVFDQDWSEPTMEGITLELTFGGSKLVQVRMRPHVILDKAQPNFMDPAGTGRVVLGQLYDASKKLLPW